MQIGKPGRPSDRGGGRTPSAFRDPTFALFVGSVTCTAIGLYKLATAQDEASLVFFAVGGALALAARHVLIRRSSDGRDSGETD